MPIAGVSKEVNLFLYYLRERSKIQEKKERGEKRPWTNDPILDKNKFCCVIRDHDRTSQEAKEVIDSLQGKNQKCAASTFRLFNRVSTLESLIEHGCIGCEDFEKIRKVIDDLSGQGPVLNATAYKIQPRGRVWNLDDICQAMVDINKVVNRGWVPSRKGRETAVDFARRTKVKGFLNYQTIQDMRWIWGPYEDEETWCLVGIGAHRGLKRLNNSYTPTHWIERQGDRPKVGEDLLIPGEYIKPLNKLLELSKRVNSEMTMFELEHNLCEFDKYCRIESGEGKGRKYTPTRSRT